MDDLFPFSKGLSAEKLKSIGLLSEYQKALTAGDGLRLQELYEKAGLDRDEARRVVATVLSSRPAS